ncbi:MAG: hypothetical protein QOI59_2120 [Gammaproteobacteria bacterium]|jgi:hypothetical protein|nr:hypothetical protein [Gammaproteobacteria bacterium]
MSDGTTEIVCSHPSSKLPILRHPIFSSTLNRLCATYSVHSPGDQTALRVDVKTRVFAEGRCAIVALVADSGTPAHAGDAISNG